ncbi:hypothetical protein ACFWQT_01875 [Streptomyces cyaneofuscatus]|uniref:hypothetical protein n=1 Tax=Streptomyces cyaneofuscatus TaxID=66883 RepID=UPI00366A0030
MDAHETAEVHHSPSSWQQPCPQPASAERTTLVEDIAERVLALSPGRLLIGIDGFTAAGKTSFGHELAQRVTKSGRPALRATLDDFKNPWKDRHLYDRESGEGYYRNAYAYETAKHLLLDPTRSPEATSCALCSIDPLTQEDHAAQTTPLAEVDPLPRMDAVVDNRDFARPKLLTS